MRRLSTSPDHVVFIPRFMCDARLFEPQTLDLSKTKTSCAVEVPKTQATIRDMSLTILDNAPVEFALAGLSMGGIIALDIMRLAPHRITHLALLNTTPYEDKSSLQRIKHMQRADRGDLLNILQDDLKPQYLSPSTSKSTLMPLITDMGRKLGVETFMHQSRALMTRKSNIEHLDRITCPTLILTGEDDRLCPPAIHMKMAKLIKNSDLKIIPNCGHLSTLEAAEAVTAHLFKHWGLKLAQKQGYDLKTHMSETV